VLWHNFSNLCSVTWIQPGSIIFFLKFIFNLKKNKKGGFRAYGSTRLSLCKEKLRHVGRPSSSSPRIGAWFYFLYILKGFIPFLEKKNMKVTHHLPRQTTCWGSAFFIQINLIFKSFQTKKNTWPTFLEHS
jgi:hypothetical protein